MAKKKQITDGELMKLINKGLDCQEILDKTGIKLLTLQRRVKNLMVSEKKYIEVKNLFKPSNQVKYKGLGITIHKNKLVESNFKEDDEFILEFNKDGITLSVIKDD